RFRLDGVMSEQGALPREAAPILVSRVKVLGKMDMTLRSLPQDGQFSLELSDGRMVHLRASTFPAIHGENLVIRILLAHQIIAMGELGVDETEKDTLDRLLTQPSGLIIVCGPTGSGKTSSLYAMIRELDTKNLSVVTLEDPIEVELDDVVQGQTNVRQGFTFASGLRAILRQDPDVILVGEMRDSETAQIALQASLTGHMVFTTLHTSSAIETITRLIDLGVESWIVANALQAVVAHRLLRVLCSCATHRVLPHDIRAAEDDDRVILKAGTRVRQAKGCDKCHQTGYVGRTGIFEVVEIDDEIRELIKGRAGTKQFRAVARKASRSLRELGLLRVKKGVTSLEEVLRVT
ncbi:MAG: GspE/PulE family protein, partial [Myxococcota bacterium]